MKYIVVSFSLILLTFNCVFAFMYDDTKNFKEQNDLLNSERKLKYRKNQSYSQQPIRVIKDIYLEQDNKKLLDFIDFKITAFVFKHVINKSGSKKDLEVQQQEFIKFKYDLMRLIISENIINNKPYKFEPSNVIKQLKKIKKIKNVEMLSNYYLNI